MGRSTTSDRSGSGLRGAMGAEEKSGPAIDKDSRAADTEASHQTHERQRESCVIPVEIAGMSIEVIEHGSGRDVLFLHPENYFARQHDFLSALAARWHVVTPRHPGFDGNTPPDNFRSVSDLAYLYLDLLAQLDLRNVFVVGSSLGGWIALEMAVRDLGRIGGLALLAPIGAKLSGREVRDFTDLNALPEEDVLAALFHDPHANGPRYDELDDQQMTEIARERQFLAYYAWQPYLHNPGLDRWLHRVACPTLLLWGESDGLVSTDYARQLADGLPTARLEILSECGHYPQIEAPEAALAALSTFERTAGGRGSTG